MLIVKNLQKIYENSERGIKKLDLTLNDGSICAFIGSNGAGKSTSIKSIVGIHPFDNGEVILDGINLLKNPKLFKLNMGYAADSPELYDNLKGYEYLNFIGSIYRISNEDFEKRVSYLVNKLNVTEALSQLISTYSHGMKQKLILISIFLHNPKLIVLDEPFVGLDPNATFFLIDELKKRAQHGSIIIYSTHVLEVAEKLCNHVVLIDNGIVKVNDEMTEVIKESSLNTIFKRETNYEEQ